MAPPSILEAGLFSLGEASLPEWQLLQFGEYRAARALLAFAPPLLCAVGVTGNVMTLLVLTFSALRHSACCKYLSALAVTDTVILILNLCFNFVDVFVLSIRVSDVACKTYYFLFFTSVHLSSWLLVAVTTQRCLVVCRPMTSFFVTSNRCTVYVIGGLAAASVVLNSHHLAVRELLWSNSTLQPVCYTRGEASKTFIQDYWPWVDAAVYCFVPASCLVVLNVLIIRTLRKAASFRSHHRSRPNQFRMSPAKKKCGQSRRNNDAETRTTERYVVKTSPPASNFSTRRTVAAEIAPPNAADTEHVAITISSATDVNSLKRSSSDGMFNTTQNASLSSLESIPLELDELPYSVTANTSSGADVNSCSSDPISPSSSHKKGLTPPQPEDLIDTTQNGASQATSATEGYSSHPVSPSASWKGLTPLQPEDLTDTTQNGASQATSATEGYSSYPVSPSASWKSLTPPQPEDLTGTTQNTATQIAPATEGSTDRTHLPPCSPDVVGSSATTRNKTSDSFPSVVTANNNVSLQASPRAAAAEYNPPKPRDLSDVNQATRAASAREINCRSDSPISSGAMSASVPSSDQETGTRFASSTTPQPHGRTDNTATLASSATDIINRRSESPVSSGAIDVPAFSGAGRRRSDSIIESIPQPRDRTANNNAATHVPSETTSRGSGTRASRSTTTLNTNNAGSTETALGQPPDTQAPAQRSGSDEGVNGRGQSRQLTMMPLLASVVFVTLSAPIAVILVVEHVVWQRDTPRQVAVYTLVRIVVNTMMFVNHSINFLLYCFAGSSFRSHWYSLFCCNDVRTRLATRCCAGLASLRSRLCGLFKLAGAGTAVDSYNPTTAARDRNVAVERSITLHNFKLTGTNGVGSTFGSTRVLRASI